MLLHLKLLIIYYAYIAPKFAPVITLKVDFFMTQLIRWCFIALMEIEKLGAIFDREIKSKEAVKRGKMQRKQVILEHFYRIPNRKSLNPHKIATTIVERMGKNALSIDTIKNYLREEELI